MNIHIRKQTQDDLDRQAREQEHADDLAIRRGKYYPEDKNQLLTKRRPQVFIFRPEDLDNEEVILAVENTPTYKRTQQMVKELRRRIVDENESAKPKEEDNNVNGIISFA